MNSIEHRSRLLQFFLRVAGYVGIVLVTLAVVDVAMIFLDIMPPHYQRGHPELGWVTGVPTGRMQTVDCLENSTRETLHFTRNEDGVRSSISSQRMRQDTALLKIAVSGDSQTDLCAPNEAVHFGVMETALKERGVPAAVFAYGAGKYSPLQAYLAVKKPMAEYHADALVLNVYTGNDFYDMLRVDDRPHFVKSGAGYRIAPPVWYQEFPPDAVYRSRVMFVLRSIAQRTGIRNVIVRLQYLRNVARDQNQSFVTVLRYMNDLRKSASNEVGYSAAFSAQMLNQQLFFHHFPGSRAESVNRMRALLEKVRQEQPNGLLILSPIPSYELVNAQPVDSALLHVVERLPVTHADGVREEAELYEVLRRLARETGWVFVDGLTQLRAHAGTERLYNNFDYHLLPPGSEIIGRAQAAAVLLLWPEYRRRAGKR